MTKKPTAGIFDTVDTDNGGALLNKQIRYIRSAFENMERAVPVTAAGAVVIAILHGNVSFGTQLCEALGAAADGGKSATMIRTNELRKWLIEFGPFRWSSSEKQFLVTNDKARRAKLLAKYNADPKAFVDGLLSNPFWKWKPEKAFEGFDLVKQIGALIKRADKMKDEHDGDPRVKLDGIEALRALYARTAQAQAAAANDRGTPVEVTYN